MSWDLQAGANVLLMAPHMQIAKAVRFVGSKTHYTAVPMRFGALFLKAVAQCILQPIQMKHAHKRVFLCNPGVNQPIIKMAHELNVKEPNLLSQWVFDGKKKKNTPYVQITVILQYSR